MKKRRHWIITIMLVSIGLTTIDASYAIDSSPTSPRKKATKRAPRKGIKAKQSDKASDAEARIRAAEQRAQQAEAAAAKAASDARTAQEQAAQAMEAARRANEMVARLQESVARAEQAPKSMASDIAALKKADEQSAGDMQTLRAATQATAAKVDAVDKRTEGAMTSVSKIPVKISANILFNSNYVDRGANNNDIPLFAQPRGTFADSNHQNFNTTLRQSRFGLRYDGKAFTNANLIGVFEFDLFDGKPAFANGVHFDIFRLRLAYGRIDWEKNSVEVGQDWTVFSPLNPTTYASYAIPGFSASGNLWNRLPQFRYEHREKIGGDGKFIWTTALLDPNAGDNTIYQVARTIGLGERGALPAFESRVGLTRQTFGKESSVGLSGHYSRLRAAVGVPPGQIRRPIDSYGVCTDFNSWIAPSLRISGEAFHGRALGIFSGNIFQSAIINSPLGLARGINSTGGWLEVHGEAPASYDGPWKKFSMNVGYGTEDNRSQDLIVGSRKRNQTLMVNGHYKFTPNFTFALEYRQVRTDWQGQPRARQTLNWGNLSFLYSF